MLVETKKPKLSRRKRAKAKRTLETAFDTVVTNIGTDAFLRNHLFLQKAKNGEITVGHYKITRNELGLYDVYDRKEMAYKNLYVFDAAMALVENLNMGRSRLIPMILEAEESYAKNVNDLRFFKHMIEMNTDNKEIFEHRYNMVRQRAEANLETIKKFRLVK